VSANRKGARKLLRAINALPKKLLGTEECKKLQRQLGKVRDERR